MRNPETAKRLAEAMTRKSMNAKELSEKSGVSEPSISQYLHGVFAPKNISAGKMAKVLEVNPMWLMGFDVPMESELVKSTKQDNMVITSASNHDFMYGMNEISKALTLEEQKSVLAFATFMQSQKTDDKKDDE